MTVTAGAVSSALAIGTLKNSHEKAMNITAVMLRILRAIMAIS